LLTGLIVLAWRRKSTLIPLPLLGFLLASIMVYFASRAMAFRLYVPDRHILLPFGLFSIAAFSIGIWNALLTWPSRIAAMPRAIGGLLCMGALVFAASGTGLRGPAGFNISSNRKTRVFSWLRRRTPADAVIAGEPDFMNPVQLYAVRRGFVTTETAHPFYDK